MAFGHETGQFALYFVTATQEPRPRQERQQPRNPGKSRAPRSSVNGKWIQKPGSMTWTEWIAGLSSW